MKKISFSILIFIIFFEITSVIFTKFELFLFNETPKYSLESNKKDWKTLDDYGNKWHKKKLQSSSYIKMF